MNCHRTTSRPLDILVCRGGVISGALAFGVGLAVPSAVQAALVITDVNHEVDGYNVYWLDVDNDSVNDFQVQAGADFGSLKSKTFTVFSASKTILGSYAIDRFSQGDVIDSADFLGFDFHSSGAAYDDRVNPTLFDWNTVGAHGYAGFRLQDGPNTHYGWIELTRGSLSIGQIGFQTTPGEGALIPNGAPEPASLLLIATGAVGIAAMRRRRRAAAQSDH